MADRPTFFVDRCMGKRVVTSLRDAGASVEAHDDHFSQDERDIIWIPNVSDRGWVILTKDQNIRFKIMERQAIIVAAARIIILSSGNMTGSAMSTRLVDHLSEMEEWALSQPAPFIALLGNEGLKLTTIKPPDSTTS